MYIDGCGRKVSNNTSTQCIEKSTTTLNSLQMPNWKQLIMRLWSEAIFLIPKDMEKNVKTERLQRGSLMKGNFFKTYLIV